MKTKITLVLLTFIAVFSTQGQGTLQCANNFTFSSAIFFDPAAITGCQNGASCSGTPILYDLRPTCQPVEAMDACAPAPLNTTMQNGYDLWWKFTANGSVASIVVNPSISLNVGIQALSGSTCGALTEIGSVGGSGNNVTTILNLTNLVTGQLYYFRVFGSSSIDAQRSGDICFCGSTNLQGGVLATNLLNFTATGKYKTVNINWIVAASSDAKTFELQRGIDGKTFTTVRSVNATGTNYEYTDQPSVNKIVLYRLKFTSITGKVEYSKIIPVNLIGTSSLSIYPNLVSGSSIDVESNDKLIINIFNSTGINISTKHLQTGHNNVDVSKLVNGMYFLQNTTNGEMLKFIVNK